MHVLESMPGGAEVAVRWSLCVQVQMGTTNPCNYQMHGAECNVLVS